MSSPWKKIEKPESVNLDEIMSEQLARDLQAKEDQKFYRTSPSASNNLEPEEADPYEPPEDPCSSDEMLARMLQMHFDKEHDDNLKLVEDKFNGTSKVAVSFDNYRRAPQNLDFESDSESEEPPDISERRDWDRFDNLKRQLDSIPACGYKKENGCMVTKHDVTMNGRKNACKLLSFPPDFQTGDGENFDLKLSNKVFNSLKRHSKQEEARRHKIKDKKDDRSTLQFGLDEYTKLLVIKITNKILEEVYGVISIGKEAVILNARSNLDYTEQALPPMCAIKVFKTTLSEFKQRDQYIKDDQRFKGRIGNQRARKTVHLWAEKEMHNLRRLKNAGIPCPEVVMLKEHVLVMSLIGDDRCPAPKLKDARMTDKEYSIAYQQVIDLMKRLFTKAELIHADLSEYNILWHEGLCYLIDVSQSVLLANQNASDFLMRDCFNVINFFQKKKVPNVITPDELFISITGHKYEEKKALAALQDSFKMKPHLVDQPGMETAFDFENGWERSKQELERPKLVEAPQA